MIRGPLSLRSLPLSCPSAERLRRRIGAYVLESIVVDAKRNNKKGSNRGIAPGRLHHGLVPVVRNHFRAVGKRFQLYRMSASSRLTNRLVSRNRFPAARNHAPVAGNRFLATVNHLPVSVNHFVDVSDAFERSKRAARR